MRSSIRRDVAWSLRNLCQFIIGPLCDLYLSVSQRKTILTIECYVDGYNVIKKNSNFRFKFKQIKERVISKALIA